MKKIILSILAVAAFGTANAQEIKFGVKAGANFSNFTGDAETDGRTGFYVGGLVDIGISDKFHVQPELLYSMEGADSDGVDLGVNYLRVPIMAKYYLTEALNLQAGPSVAFKIGTVEEDFDDAVKSIDFGLGLGAAYELPIGLFFDVRYNLGLANISETDAVDVKNTNFQVGLGYRF